MFFNMALFLKKRRWEKAYDDFSTGFRFKKDDFVWNSDVTFSRNDTASLAVFVRDWPLDGV